MLAFNTMTGRHAGCDSNLLWCVSARFSFLVAGMPGDVNKKGTLTFTFYWYRANSTVNRRIWWNVAGTRETFRQARHAWVYLTLFRFSLLKSEDITKPKNQSNETFNSSSLTTTGLSRFGIFSIYYMTWSKVTYITVTVNSLSNAGFVTVLHEIFRVWDFFYNLTLLHTPLILCPV